MLTVRKPAFDFSGSVPHWGDNSEAVTIFNAGAIIPTPIERYLIRVMRMAKQQLDPVADADLIETIDLFNKQEGQHYKLHNDLMTMLTAKAYPRLREFEAAFDADLKEFLATKSLAWNIAYCEGFESTGCAMARAWIDGGIKRDLRRPRVDPHAPMDVAHGRGVRAPVRRSRRAPSYLRRQGSV